MNRSIEEAKTFYPYPIAKDLKAKEVIMAASTNDPYMTVEEAIRLQSKLNVGMKIMEDAGHINAASGFGKLDCALDWLNREEECEINSEEE
jgi:predicted alpha/beta hydrolase family esterase